MNSKASPAIYDVNHSRWVDFKKSLVWWGVGSVGAIMLLFGWPYKIIRYPGAILLAYGTTMIVLLYSGQILQITPDSAAVYLDAVKIGALAQAGAACDSSLADRTRYMCLPNKSDFENADKQDPSKNEDARLYDSDCTQILLQSPAKGVQTDWLKQYNNLKCGKVIVRANAFLAPPNVPKGKINYLAGGGL